MQGKTKKLCYINILYHHNTLRHKERRYEPIAGIRKNALLSVRSEGHRISGKNRENFLSASAIMPVDLSRTLPVRREIPRACVRGCFPYAACGFISDTGNFLNQPANFFRGVDCALMALAIPEITAVFHSAKTKISSKVSPDVWAREDIFVSSSTGWLNRSQKEGQPCGAVLGREALF